MIEHGEQRTIHNRNTEAGTTRPFDALLKQVDELLQTEVVRSNEVLRQYVHAELLVVLLDLVETHKESLGPDRVAELLPMINAAQLDLPAVFSSMAEAQINFESTFSGHVRAVKEKVQTELTANDSSGLSSL